MTIRAKRTFRLQSFIGGGALLLIAGIVGLSIGIAAFTKAAGQDGWVKRSAVVVRSESKTYNSADRPRTPSYFFEYEYEVGSIKYRSDQYSARHKFTKNREAVERFKQGEQIEIYVNPQNPKQTFVELQKPGFTVYLFSIASIFALIGSYFLTFRKEVRD